MAVPIDYAPRETRRSGLRMIEPFVMMRKSLLYDTTVTPQQKILLLVIGDQAWRDESGTCRLSHEVLAVLIGREERTVRGLIKPLVDKGFIGQQRLGPTQAKAYWLIDPETAEGHRQKNDGVVLPVSRHRPKNDVTPSKNGRCHRQKNDGTPYREEPEPEIPETGPAPSAPVRASEEPPSEPIQTKPVLAVPKPTSGSQLPDEVKTQVREIWDYYRTKIQPKARVHNPKTIAKRLETFTVEEVKSGIDHFAADWWRMENNASMGADWFFESDKQVDKWVTLVPRPPKGSERTANRTNGQSYRREAEPTTGWPGSTPSAAAMAAANCPDDLPEVPL